MPKYFMQNKTLVILFGVSVDDTNYNHGISFYGDENVMNLTLTKQNNDTFYDNWADAPLTQYEEECLLQGRKNMKTGNFLTLQEFKIMVQDN